MNIEEAIIELKHLNSIGNMLGHSKHEAIETLLTAYEKEKKDNEQWEKYATNDLENQITERNNKIFELEEELKKEKEKNKNIDEFCRKELAFERRLKRENREPDEFNQGRFYVSENIRKIIEEE